MYRDIATALYKRATDEVTFKPPAWAWSLVLVDLIVLLPVFLVIGYTFQNIFPILTMIEDPAPPAYEPVSLNEDAQSFSEDAAPVADESARPGAAAKATTSSFRATFKAVYAQSGWTSLFRGLGCFVALVFSSFFVFAIISAIPFMPAFAAAGITALALSQLYAGYTIIVVTVPSTKFFWNRLPPFKKAFSAAALPTILYGIALGLQRAIPLLVATALGLTMWDPKQPDRIPQADANDAWKAIIVFLSSLALTVLLVIPAHVVLVRVQTSLLTEEDETIVPFDRSFQGKVIPAIVGGTGYVSALDAWKTFSRASWVRLIKMYLKIFAVNMALWLAICAIVIPEALFIAKFSEKVSQ